MKRFDEEKELEGHAYVLTMCLGQGDTGEFMLACT